MQCTSRGAGRGEVGAGRRYTDCQRGATRRRHPALSLAPRAAPCEHKYATTATCARDAAAISGVALQRTKPRPKGSHGKAPCG